MGSSLTKSNEAVPTKFLDGIMRNFTLGFYMCILHGTYVCISIIESESQWPGVKHVTKKNLHI